MSGLHDYCSIGDLESVKISVLEHNADVNKLNKYGVSPLIQCVSRSYRSELSGEKCNYYKTVKFLLENGADPSYESATSTSAFFEACIGENVEIVKVLVEHGVNTSNEVLSEFLIDIPGLDSLNDDIGEYIKELFKRNNKKGVSN